MCLCAKAQNNTWGDAWWGVGGLLKVKGTGNREEEREEELDSRDCGI